MSGSDNASDDLIADSLGLVRRFLAQPRIAVSIPAAPVSEALPVRDSARPCALLLSPHPDDECLTGGLPLRLKREQGWQIINIAVSLGSDSEKRTARKAELATACAILGFDCVLSDADGFSGVARTTRQESLPAWQKMTARLADIIRHCRPQAIFLPHERDAHSTHIGTHLLGVDALASLGDAFTCTLVQTEYWHPIEEPNLMIGIGESDAAKMLAALSCHAGENARNAFDARFPSYLIDNVRRGSERVGGKGVPSAESDFAMLYKIGLWRGGKFAPSALKRIVGVVDSAGALFE